jgi:hypothetical protein
MSILTPLKKPLNNIEMPVYGQFSGPAPRFYSSGKHWTVDVGRTIGQVEFMPEKLDYALLAQQRDYSERIYGKSSHKDVVNKSFRPPLLTFEDTKPLNRIPRGFTVPHTNPSTVEGGYHMQPRDSQWLTEFTASNDKQHFTTERIKHGYTFPASYYRPVHTNGGIGGVVPDAKVRLKRPSTSVNTIQSMTSFTPTDHLGDSQLTLEQNREMVSVDSGHHSNFRTRHLSDVQLDDIEYLSASAAPSVKHGAQPQTGREDFVLLDTPKSTTSFATYQTAPTDITNHEHPDIELIAKTDLTHWRTNTNMPKQIMSSPLKGSASIKLEKDIPRSRMEPHINAGYQKPIQPPAPVMRDKSALQPKSYTTKGHIKQAGPTVGTTGRGLNCVGDVCTLK